MCEGCSWDEIARALPTRLPLEAAGKQHDTKVCQQLQGSYTLVIAGDIVQRNGTTQW